MTVRAVLGYDGSPAAAGAIEAGAQLFPGAHAWITYLWVPPFASEQIRRRLWAQARNIDDLIAAEDREGEREARRITAMGVTLAGAAGWDATPLLERTYAAEGTAIAQTAERVDADLVIVAARGLGGAASVLGSVSDMVVHYCSRPVLVVPQPLLSEEYDALLDGPIVVGWDGSESAGAALQTAERLFPDRRIVAVSVDEATKVPAQPDADSNGRLVHVHIDRGRGRQARGTATAIVAAADEQRAAAVVVGSRGRSAVREIILGSVAMGVLHESHRPVMVVPNRSQPEGS
ncbi:MAG: universal stress protein [Mycobacterium sp.]